MRPKTAAQINISLVRQEETKKLFRMLPNKFK